MTQLPYNMQRWGAWWEQQQEYVCPPLRPLASITPDEREFDRALMRAAFGDPERALEILDGK